jgi:hypothetical protein
MYFTSLQISVVCCRKPVVYISLSSERSEEDPRRA